MEPGTPIRITFELEATIRNVEGIMELARASVREVHLEEDWNEAYPEDLQDAIQTLFSNAVLEMLPVDGPLDPSSSSTQVDVVPDAWWAKVSKNERGESEPDETSSNKQIKSFTQGLVYGLIPAEDLEPDGENIRRIDRLIDIPQPNLLSWMKVRRKSDGKVIRRKGYTWKTYAELLILDGEPYQLVRHGELWYTTHGPLGGRLLTQKELMSMALDVAWRSGFGNQGD